MHCRGGLLHTLPISLYPIQITRMSLHPDRTPFHRPSSHFLFRGYLAPLRLLVPPLPRFSTSCRDTLDVKKLTLRYIGCYTDTTAKRAFAHELTDSVPGGAANMTVANCARAANVTGYVLFGIEYRYVSSCTSCRDADGTVKNAGPAGASTLLPRFEVMHLVPCHAKATARSIAVMVTTFKPTS
jgi:hypothetical protein